MSFLNHLTWRHATKSFDPSYDIPEAKMEKLREAIQMTPTSFGLQPFHVIEVNDPAVRKQIRSIAWDQAQVTESSRLLVFCARRDIESRIYDYLELMSGGDTEQRKTLQGFEDVMKQFLEQLSPEQQKAWVDRQVYIALGFALVAAAELEIDSCAMEGFVPGELKKIMQLPEHLDPVVLLPLGKRKDPANPEKVRFPQTELFS